MIECLLCVSALSFSFENDYFYGTDRHYTNGFRLEASPQVGDQPPEWSLTLAEVLPWFSRQGALRHSYAVGQALYTPSDITLKDPPRSDRPYAGWLYGSVSLARQGLERLDEVGVTLGIVGPSAQGEWVQTRVHELRGNDIPQGWHTQLRDELGLIVAGRSSWRQKSVVSPFGATLGGQMDLTPYLGVSLGNVLTTASAGISLRFGRRLPEGFPPVRAQPGQPSFLQTPNADRNSAYVFLAAEARAVGRNLFLDGNTFSDSRSVDKRPLVGELQAGVVWSVGGLRLSYVQVARTREFFGQESRDVYGSLQVAVAF